MIIIDKHKWLKNLVFVLFSATRSGLQYTTTKAIKDSWGVIFIVLSEQGKVMGSRFKGLSSVYVELMDGRAAESFFTLLSNFSSPDLSGFQCSSPANIHSDGVYVERG